MSWKKTNDQPLSKDISSKERVLVEREDQGPGKTPVFRGTTTLKSSLTRIAFVLVDIESKKKWVNRLEGHNLIEGDVFGLDYSTYEHYNLSWPVSDREYVLKAKWNIDKTSDNPSATITISSTSHKDYPIRKDRIRGDLEKLTFHLKQVAPQKTQVIVEIKVDPKGQLPGFLANLIQKNWPLTTLRALNQIAKQGKETHPLFN